MFRFLADLRREYGIGAVLFFVLPRLVFSVLCFLFVIWNVFS